MAILVDRQTRLVVQGLTGREGRFHALRNRDYGTNVVAGVTPGKAGQDVEGIPVFNTVASAVAETGANTSLIFVPARFAVDALYEAADAGIGVVVLITENIPVLDMTRAYNYIKAKGVALVGPNCPGVISPGKANVGIIPGEITHAGPVGLVSRSGTLTYQVMYEMAAAGVGQTTCVGIGGDPVVGSSFIDVLARFQDDPETEAVVMIGEIGGNAEETAARFVKEQMTKPVVAFIAGQNAPPGKRMGHAGAIIAGGKGAASDKIAALEAAGVVVARSPAAIGETLAKRVPSLAG
ncbi:MAG: succinate--CoA ligase subunit alpha, partial [Actinomycetota bacterium]